MRDWYEAAKDAANKATGLKHSSFAHAFSAYWDAQVAGTITAAVKPQTKPADLTAAPSQSDFNNLLALLKTAGVLK